MKLSIYLSIFINYCKFETFWVCSFGKVWTVWDFRRRTGRRKQRRCRRSRPSEAPWIVQFVQFWQRSSQIIRDQRFIKENRRSPRLVFGEVLLSSEILRSDRDLKRFNLKLSEVSQLFPTLPNSSQLLWTSCEFASALAPSRDRSTGCGWQAHRHASWCQRPSLPGLKLRNHRKSAHGSIQKFKTVIIVKTRERSFRQQKIDPRMPRLDDLLTKQKRKDNHL